MQKVLQKTGVIEVGAQKAATANLVYDPLFGSQMFCYIFIWDAVKRLRSSNVGGALQNDNCDSDDFESMLEVDVECRFFYIIQFDYGGHFHFHI